MLYNLENFWTGMCPFKTLPVLILRRYMLFGLVPAEMEFGVKYIEILQDEFESACKHSGAQLGGLFSRNAKSF